MVTGAKSVAQDPDTHTMSDDCIGPFKKMPLAS